PRGIVQEFELKDCHRDCQNCHLEKDFKNSSSNNNLSCSSHGNNSHNDNSEGKGTQPNQQSQENLWQENKSTFGEDHSGLIIGGVVVASLISLATVLVIKNQKSINHGKKI